MAKQSGVSITQKKGKSNISFTHERSELITKVENNLGGWRFFGYLYNTAMFRVLLLQLLMLLSVAPIVANVLLSNSSINTLAGQLPYSATFGLGLMPWFGLETFVESGVLAINQRMYLWMLLCIPVVTIGLSGGFAVIRDAYWTDKIRVFKPFLQGIKQMALRFLPFTVIIAAGVLGLFYINQALKGVAQWAVIVIDVVIIAVLALVLLIGLVYLGTSTLYKEKVGVGLANAFKLTFRHFFTNLGTFIVMAAPIVLMGFNIPFIQLMIAIMMAMFGGLYIGLIWMIHMIRVTAPYAK